MKNLLRMFRVCFLISIAFLVVGCGNKGAIDEAKAYQIRTETDQEVKNQEQSRGIIAEKERQKEIDNAYWNEVSSSNIKVVKQSVMFVVYSIGIAFCVFILGGGWAAKETIIGLGRACVEKAYLEAQLVHMDEKTMTFPAIRYREIDGNHFVTMLSTGEVFRLNKEQQANPRLIAALAQVSTTGIYAKEAAKVGILHGNNIPVLNPTLLIDLETE